MSYLNKFIVDRQIEKFAETTTVAPPISAPPISAPPISAPPISTPPISTPPQKKDTKKDTNTQKKDNKNNKNNEEGFYGTRGFEFFLDFFKTFTNGRSLALLFFYITIGTTVAYYTNLQLHKEKPLAFIILWVLCGIAFFLCLSVGYFSDTILGRSIIKPNFDTPQIDSLSSVPLVM